MTTLTVDTWQFVRVMVAIEESQTPNSPPSKLKGPKKQSSKQPWRQLAARWKTEWEELDAQLSELAQTDFDSYAALMMEHQVSLGELTSAEVSVFSEILKHITSQMGQQLKTATKNKDASLESDLLFERSELNRLRESLGSERND